MGDILGVAQDTLLGCGSLSNQYPAYACSSLGEGCRTYEEGILFKLEICCCLENL